MITFQMGWDGTVRRRWLGALALLAALGMLLAGETVLRNRLQGAAFLIFWLACFGFTFLAMLVAMWDARIVRLRTQRAQRELLQATVHKIIEEAQTKPESSGKKEPS